MNRRRIGVNFNGEGDAEIRLWAPLIKEVAIRINDKKSIALQQQDYGYWILTTPELKVNDRYRFIADGKELPDPASLSQPDGVHGPSQVFDPQVFKWNDEIWQNPACGDYIIYELHTGTFSPQGNFEGIEKRLDHLLELGVTAIELMPVAQFPGERNWGYDGVYPFAVQNSYGGPQGLQHLVNVCHSKGVAIVLDVVYNHLGPEGNYLPAFAPYFTEKYQTPWGNAINYDDAWCDSVREYFIGNALMWFRDFHIDALRMDAVHAIKDFSPKHFLKELKEKIDKLSEETGKTYHLLIECDLNDTRYIDSIPDNGYGMDAQWTDEFHHALRVTAGEKKIGYYSDFNGVTDLAKAYRDAYVYTGQYSAQRFKKFGVPANNPGEQFIVFSQNHDQVGNRMLGERSSMLFSFEMQKLLAAAVIVSPFMTLLFMGEEWSAQTPFLYFVSHSDPDLIKAVQKGRSKEFKDFHDKGEAPDPQSPDTFERSKLKWDELQHDKANAMFRYYQTLIRLKKSNTVLKSKSREDMEVSFNDEANTLQLTRVAEQQRVLCLMNFSKQERTITINQHGQWGKLLGSADAEWHGKGHHSPEMVTLNDQVAVAAESIVIYTKYV